MQRHRAAHSGKFSVSSLDLVYGHTAVLMDNAVRPPLHAEHIFIRRKCHLQRNLRLIFRPHPALDHAVDTSALLHGVLRRYMPAVVNVPMAQDEFHQPADRDAHLL